MSYRLIPSEQTLDGVVLWLGSICQRGTRCLSLDFLEDLSQLVSVHPIMVKVAEFFLKILLVAFNPFNSVVVEGTKKDPSAVWSWSRFFEDGIILWSLDKRKFWVDRKSVV